MSNFKAHGTLEELVLEGDNENIIINIMDGKRLSRPDIFAEDEAQGLNLNAAMMLALIGLPKKMRQDAVKIVLEKCGEDSEMFRFIINAFGIVEDDDVPDDKELRCLKAIREKDELVVAALSCYVAGALVHELSDELITAVNAMSPETREVLFIYGFDVKPLVLFLKKLMAPDEKEEAVVPEVAKLTYDERMKVINEILEALLDKDEMNISEDDIDDDDDEWDDDDDDEWDEDDDDDDDDNIIDLDELLGDGDDDDDDGDDDRKGHITKI